MDIIIIVAILIVIGGILFKLVDFYIDYKNPYTEEVVKEGTIVNSKGSNVGNWRFIKRTYKNGKTTFHERNYKS